MLKYPDAVPSVTMEMPPEPRVSVLPTPDSMSGFGAFPMLPCMEIPRSETDSSSKSVESEL